MNQIANSEIDKAEVLPKIESSYQKPIQFNSVIKHLNTFIQTIYNRGAYPIPIFTSGKIVDVEKRTGNYHYFGLIHSGNYLPAKIKNGGDSFQKLKSGSEAIVKGYFNLESPQNKPYFFEIRLNVIEIFSMGEEKTISTQDVVAKSIPESIKSIGLVTSKNSEAIQDFYKGLKFVKFKVKIKVHAINLFNSDSILDGIKSADAYGHDVLVLTRGGGSHQSSFFYSLLMPLASGHSTGKWTVYLQHPSEDLNHFSKNQSRVG